MKSVNKNLAWRVTRVFEGIKHSGPLRSVVQLPISELASPVSLLKVSLYCFRSAETTTDLTQAEGELGSQRAV